MYYQFFFLDYTQAVVTERDLAQRLILAPWVFLNATSLDSVYDGMISQVRKIKDGNLLFIAEFALLCLFI